MSDRDFVVCWFSFFVDLWSGLFDFKGITKKSSATWPIVQVALHVILLAEAVFKFFCESFGLMEAGILVDIFQVVV